MRNSRLNSFCWGIFGLAIALTSGCGDDGRPQRYEREGRVTFNGQPVAKGEIIISPDHSKGASGPGTTVTFEDGKYRTRKGKGTLSGPHIVIVSGYDGHQGANDPTREPHPWGNTLFSGHRVDIDFPAEASTHHFDVED